MQALILAAGMGRRLGEFTSENTKCMVEVNGVRLIDRMLNQLQQRKLSRIIIVTGYEGDKLKKHILSAHPNLNIIYVDNPLYDKTNNIYSLWLAKEYFEEEDTLLLESDLIFEDEILDKALEHKEANCALVSKYQTWMDGTMVRIDDDNNIVNIIPKKAFKYKDTDSYYKTVNIYKFSKDFILDIYIPFLEAYIKVLGENEYYEQVLRVITLIDKADIKALDISGLKWYEIDDVQDLRIAETIFAKPELRLQKLQASYGGYWRYPDLLDFCYLVNPYFPKHRMIEELKANFEPLLRDYPSGMKINSLLGSKYFNLREEYVVVGNGAAELIKSLMSNSRGCIGTAYPTFEEYPNRKLEDNLVIFKPQNSEFKYTKDDLINFFQDKNIQTLLIINPDNPSGNFIPIEDLLELIDWCKQRKTEIIIDESFVDFSEKGVENTLLKNSILETNPHLCVIKSISKSFGVPGLRLGVLATSNKEKIASIRKDVAIWNINSFAEFYMQIFSKYERDYKEGLEKFREDRKLFFNELSKIPYLKVIPSEANYFLCEITDNFSSYDLTLKLLTDYNILIKDCNHKKGFPTDKQYIRIAVRNTSDNIKLIKAFNQVSNEDYNR